VSLMQILTAEHAESAEFFIINFCVLPLRGTRQRTQRWKSLYSVESFVFPAPGLTSLPAQRCGWQAV